jgi:hypothetical protein
MSAVFYEEIAQSSKRIRMSSMNVSQIMETDTNIAGNAEPGVQSEDFAEPVRVNQTYIPARNRDL